MHVEVCSAGLLWHTLTCFLVSRLQVLRWFEHNQPVVSADGEGPRDYAAEAKLLACRLLEEQCGTVALLLTDMAKVRLCLRTGFSKCCPLRVVLPGYVVVRTKVRGLAIRPTAHVQWKHSRDT